MNNLFKKDLKIKILSVIAAFILWLYVYNTDNPFNDVTFKNINLKIENETSLSDRGIVIKNNYKKTIDITIRGRKEALDKVRDSDFEAVLDFSKVKSENDKYVDITPPVCSQKDVSIEDYSPGRIELSLTKVKNNSFQIEIIPNVTLKQNYKLLKVTPDSETVTLEGEEAIIDSVGAVTASLDIKNLDRDVSQSVPCKVLDKDGKEIAVLSRNLNVVVKVEVAKEVPVTLVVNGTPNKDFVEVSRSVLPDKVRITGTPEKLSSITELQTEPLDISNIKKNVNAAAVIKLPDGIKLADSSKEVSVSIAVEALVLKEINIAKSDITMVNTAIDNSLSYEIKTESAVISLKGKASELASINAASLKPTIDLNGLGEGVHKIPLNIVLPGQVKLMQEVNIEVKVVKGPEPGVT